MKPKTRQWFREWGDIFLLRDRWAGISFYILLTLFGLFIIIVKGAPIQP